MTVTITEYDNGLKGTLSGRLDTAASEQCAKDMQPFMEQAHRNIELDMAQLEYISSSGLRILLTLLKQVHSKGGQLTIRNLSEGIREVFTLTGFFRIFDIR